MNLPLERHIHTLTANQGPAPEMIAAFQSDSALHLLTTYAVHGSLWDRMCGLRDGGESSQAGRMAEDEIRWWGAQMVGAIEWLHGQGFVHRYVVPPRTVLTTGISSRTTSSSILPPDSP
jgi:serine/threonine protein kinase